MRSALTLQARAVMNELACLGSAAAVETEAGELLLEQLAPVSGDKAARPRVLAM